MFMRDPSDAELLSAADTASFERFYRRHFETVLGFFARRTRDPELAADLTAETFAAALTARHRYRPERGRADSWLFAIAYHKLADSQRRGAADDRARRRLRMERIDLTDADMLRIEQLADEDRARATVELLPAEQRDAITAHIVRGRSYAEIADSLSTSEVVVRKRVSRGLATVRRLIGEGERP
jgi:RNA polymerase sigma-70 factor (ECF subfamily)